MNESESSQSERGSQSARSNKALYELTVIMLVTILLSILIQEFKGVMMFLPLAYLFIEKRRTVSAWAEYGVRREDYLNALKNN